MPGRAFVSIRHPNTERHDAFMRGIAALGYEPMPAFSGNCGSDDVFITWNRHAGQDAMARQAAQNGCPVIVAENGYLGEMGQYFALARDHHNGAGEWPEEQSIRELPGLMRPWRAGGNHILVLPARGIGEPGIAQPRMWAREIVGQLARVTRRKVVVREHPGNKRNDVSLEEAWRDAWAVVTWGSGAAIKAIMAGVPVFHCLPQWIGGPAACFGIDDIENPFMGDRTAFLRRLSWAQWSLDEVRSGLPFRRLLELSAW